MPLQRARGAESRVRYRLSNGPLRVQSNATFFLKTRRVFCNVGHTSVVTDMSVSCKAHRFGESRWHRG
ncbi:MAG: hypothetical protein E7513_03520 [Ruminococcaceae bacterium]|nr:hypothetical protein [Oscillospiraceae bacterium]